MYGIILSEGNSMSSLNRVQHSVMYAVYFTKFGRLSATANLGKNVSSCIVHQRMSYPKRLDYAVDK